MSVSYYFGEKYIPHPGDYVVGSVPDMASSGVYVECDGDEYFTPYSYFGGVASKQEILYFAVGKHVSGHVGCGNVWKLLAMLIKTKEATS